MTEEQTIRKALAEARQAIEDIENLVTEPRDGKTQQQRLQGVLSRCADARERMNEAFAIMDEENPGGDTGE